MKRFLLGLAALSVLATTSLPAYALNPQPLPPKIFKQLVIKEKAKFVLKHKIAKHKFIKH